MFSSGKALLPTGDDLLVHHLMSGLLQTFNAAERRLLVNAVA